MASGTINFPTGGSSYKTITGRINWEVVSINSGVYPPQSKVHTKLYAKVGTGGTTGKSWNGYVQVGDNSRHSFSSLSSSTTISGSYVLLKEYDDWITHNADGSKTVTISGKVGGPSGTSISGVSSSGSGSANLGTILTSSSIISVTNGTTPYKPSVVFKPTSSSFKFKIKYSYGSWSYTTDFISPSSTNNYTYNGYTINSEDIAQYMSTSSANFTASLTTYDSNNNQIGTVSTKQFTVTLNESYKPSVSIGEVSDIAGIIPSSWGILVQGKSKLSFSISATASEGSTIKSYSTDVAGVKYQTQNIETDFILSSGKITTTVTDSRGRTGSSNKDYVVYPYSEPIITVANVDRCDENGNITDKGNYLKYSFSSNISPCANKNSATYSLGYKLSTSDTYTYVNISNDVNDLLLSGVIFDPELEYNIQFKVIDSLNSVKTTTLNLGTPFRLVHYNKNKKAIAIGKSSKAGSDEKLLEIALPLSFEEESKNSVLGVVYPTGGTTGQVLSKKTDVDYDVEWKTLGADEAPIGSITASVASGTTSMNSFTAWSWKTVPLSRVMRQVNSSFALEGNFLVNKSNKTINVLVSANGMFYNNSSSSITYDVGIFNNTSMIADAYLSCNPKSWNSVQLSSILLSINPDDKISLTVRFGADTTANVNGEGTYITIQELEVPVFFGNDSAIVESGSNANGTYVKYSDGRMECYKRVTQTGVKLTGTWYGLYINENDTTVDLGNYAATFIEEPVVNITYMGGNGCWIINNNYHSASSPGKVQLCTVSSRTIGTCILDVTAKGRWK